MSIVSNLKSSLIIFASIGFSQPILAAQQDTHAFGSFESGTNTIVRPSQTDPAYKYLWNEYTDIRSGYSEISKEAARIGNYGLKTTITNVESGPAISQQQFYPRTDTEYKYAREYSENAASWKLNTYNRLRFWVKVPQDTAEVLPEQSNFHFGTYVRATTADRNSAESDNGHYYHQMNIPYTGVWHQVIIDWHPSHQRSHPGGTDEGLKQYPTNQPGYNYFDLLTRFYLQVNGSPKSYPQVVYADGFELYREDADEDIYQIYSLNAAYRKSDNLIHVGWNRPKEDNAAVHEVRYAFSDIHKMGWSSATPAPDGVLKVGGWGGYNAVRYRTTQIDVSGKSQIYIAIKPQGATKFRQIIVPVNDSVEAESPPSPPQSIQGQPL